MERLAAARCEILRREELLERLQKRKQTLARTGTLGPVRKTLALAEPLSDEQLELLDRNTELCEQVEADDEEVDILEKQIDQEAVALLIRFHPVASDMREVVSAMKIGGHLGVATADGQLWKAFL